jgi:hypothetical protein
MPDLPVRELGRMIATAFRLKTRPLAVIGADEPPADAIPLPSVHRCIATTMARMAIEDGPSAVYLGMDVRQGCCPGGLSHAGYIMRPPAISYFVSTGRPDIPDAPAEYLKAGPGLVDACFDAIDPIIPAGNYLVIRSCESVPVGETGVRAVTCFGTAEQIRNMAALVHFDRAEPFFPVLVPWGPACATLVTYPAGMATGAPRDSAFMGPQDPTANYAIPADILAIGLPLAVARRMGENIGRSFISRRAGIAFPERGTE